MAIKPTNRTARASQTTQEYSLGLTSNYSFDAATSGKSECRLDNLTTGTQVGQEYISFRRSVLKDGVNTIAKPLNGVGNKSVPAVSYAVQLDTIITEELGDGLKVDHPLVAYLTIRHDLSGAITTSDVEEVVERVISACRKEADNSWRFADLMRGVLVPRQD